ncbi:MULTISPECIES: GNAT family N-acetyltransferase [Actinomadura]|uniref:GNAT family N-acetyltransferase n=1 Tax=Actinomadura yumaensis TaxID=111807 RepID=A0ABW2D156_9ACTN|nr:GNAT family protein [Actinomadura sp. J1-007]MWK36440.1 GNAT family N-acetyltransferase [Actinomadura sp. J1-007]
MSVSGMGAGHQVDTEDGPVLQRGRNVLLREIAPSDLHTLTQIWTSPELMANMASDVRTPEECAAVVAQALADARQRPRRSYRMAVVRCRDDAVIGTIAVDVERNLSAACYGANLTADAQRQRAGHEGFHLLCGFVFEELGLHRLSMAALVGNTTVEKILTSAGAGRVGTIREYAFKNGRWWDFTLFSLLDHEWRARRDELAHTFSQA